MDKIDELLTRGVDKIYPSREELEQVLRSEKKLKVYQGFDPTSPELHIGHLIGIRKLAQWQKSGHEVIFLIGDFTAMVGDPSGKTTARQVLSHEQTLKNAKSYKKQVGNLLNFNGPNPVMIKYNGDWLGKMEAIDFFKLAHHLTFNQIIERDLFQERLKRGEEVYGNELLYPFMQAYDSVAMNVDVEIGGTDQLFNMLMGRKLMRNILKKDKFVMTTPLLTDSSGQKIGKTEGNVIALTDKPEDLFAKIMTLGDEIIVKGLEYLTDIPMEEIQRIDTSLQNGENPIKFKKLLAFEITKQLNGENEARKAQDIFEGKTEAVIPTVNIPYASLATVADTVIESGLLKSMSETKRKFDEGGIKLNDEIPESLKTKVEPGTVVSVGRQKVKVEVK